MVRKLTDDETKVLAGISAVVNIIVDQVTPQRLDSLRVLDGANKAQLDKFHERFSALPIRLAKLMDSGRVVVEENLPAGMGANTANGFEADGLTPTVELQLRPSFLILDGTGTFTHCALTLIHELSHSLFERPIFPVRDYTYRNSWAHGVISPAVAIENADTYADVGARIADTLPNSVPGMYTEHGRLASQRRDLNEMPYRTLNVGPALAWAALKINRAWLRTDDYTWLAKFTIGSANWDARVAHWKAHDPSRHRLLELEEFLRNHMGLMGDRYGATYGLATASHKTADNMTAFIRTIKGTLDALNPVLVPAGQEIAYDDATKVLTIPHALASTQAVQLGDLILRTLVDRTEFPDKTDPGLTKLQEFKRVLPGTFADFDRPQEKARVDELRTELRALPSPKTTLAEWNAASAALDIALIEGFSFGWESAALNLQIAGPETLKILKTLHESQAEGIARVVGARHRLGAQEPVRRKAAIASILGTLQEFAAKSTQLYPATQAPYTTMINNLQPHAA